MSILLTLLMLLSPSTPFQEQPAPAPRIAYSSYLGGPGDESLAVAVAPDGAVYAAATTTSRTLPLRGAGAMEAGVRSDVWVGRLSPDGRPVLWSTYLAGRGMDSLGDLAVDPAGGVVVVGSTNSGEFHQHGPEQQRLAGDKDSFVTKLSESGEVVFSRLHGASQGDHATAVAVDPTGASYVLGYTFSFDFPATEAAMKTESTTDSEDATLVKLTPTGEVVYSTRLGGDAGGELGYDVALGPDGSAYVSGWTGSEDFPTVDAAQSEYAGSYDAFLARVDPTGSALEFSTFLGGKSLEGGGFLAAGPDGVAVALTTYSRELETTGFQQEGGGGKNDAYLATFSSEGAFLAGSYLGGGGTENVTGVLVADDGLYVTGSTGSEDFPVESAFQRRFAGRSKDDPYLAEGFVTKVTDDLSEMTYSSFFGGSGDDGVDGLSGRPGALWLSGTTYSRDLPTERARDDTWSGGADGWLARIAG